MSISKSQTEKIGSIFNGNRFVIPTYQRKYSWTLKERKALWEDIDESINSSMSHFIGTLSFMENKMDGLATDTQYEVIDGQQRITSLFILLSVLIDRLPEGAIKNAQKTAFIGNPDNLKLEPLGIDGAFLKKLLFDFIDIDISDVTKRSQKLMYAAKREFIAFTNSLSSKQIEERIIFIKDKIEILVFNVNDQAQAVKMFSIINDRGLPLRILDKTKSILMLYSTLHLQGVLNQSINECFERIFDSYDDILVWKERLGILGRLEENTIFTQHYYSAYDQFRELWNYRDSAETIFNNLKIKCENLKDDTPQLAAFISSYIFDFSAFAENYARLIQDVEKKSIYTKPFQYLEFTATVYPLIVRLYSQNKLDALLPLLECIEVRVFKLTGTTAIKDIYYLSSHVAGQNMDVENIKNRLLSFSQKFMSDFNFKTALGNSIVGNGAVKYILSEYNNDHLSIEKYNNLQVEHIFSNNPDFDPLSYGFIEGYDYEKGKIGNLGLLEEGINKGIGNSVPLNKVSGYLKSAVRETRNLAGEIQLGNFQKNNVDIRREKIIEFCLQRFTLS